MSMMIQMKKRGSEALGETHMSVANVMATPNAFREVLDYHDAVGAVGIGDIETAMMGLR